MNSIIIALNIIRRLVKEIPAIGFLIIFPIIGAILAVAMSGSKTVYKIGIANVSAPGHQLIQAIENTGKFSVVTLDENTIESQVKNKGIKAGIILPEDFANKLENKNVGKVKLIGRQNESVIMELDGLINGYIGRIYSGEKVEIENKPEAKINNTDTPRMAMGFLTMFMLLFLGNGMGIILEDKGKKTFMRTFCAPLKEYEMVLGNVLANIVLGVVQIILFLVATKYLLDIDWKMPVIYVFVIMFAFLISVMGLSIGLIGFIRSSQIYAVANSLLATMTCMLGGSFFNIQFMNDTMKKIANFMPQKWVMEAFDKLAAGGTLVNVKINLLILLLFGAAFFTFGVKVLKPVEEDL
ncbi:MAG: ABC transporter permease [Clostridia bacterium]|nr:ABC transporter permease [Clostridia bacterium]